MPFDPMHLLYLGIVRSLVFHFCEYSFIDEFSVSNILRSVRVPVYFRRKPRSLVFKMKWKANEWKHLILYYFVIFFPEDGNKDLCVLLTLLSTVMHMLMLPEMSDTTFEDAEIFIRDFRMMCCELFGETSQSFSMHALCHLPLQVKMFGPLWAVSASLFESAYGHLKRFVTGTRNEGQLIVRRFWFQRNLTRGKCRGDSSYSSPTPIGSAFSSDNFSENGVCSDSALCYHRFLYRGICYHSEKYPRKQSVKLSIIIEVIYFVR